MESMKSEPLAIVYIYPEDAPPIPESNLNDLCVILLSQIYNFTCDQEDVSVICEEASKEIMPFVKNCDKSI